jgi:outer membrane murein-binding lipoprotein Lpp
MDFKESESEGADARGGIAGLEEKTNQHSHVIAMLQHKVTQLSTDFGRLVSEVSALRSAAVGIQTLSEEVSALQTQIGQKVSDVIVAELSTKFNELGKEVLTLKAQIAAMPLTVTSSQNHEFHIITGLFDHLAFSGDEYPLKTRTFTSLTIFSIKSSLFLQTFLIVPKIYLCCSKLTIISLSFF